MPVLNWIGKDKVVNHDKELPFRVLKRVKELSVGDNNNNLLVEGDNLEALKALMPFYYNKVKFIYIDPPYNTGNQTWVYNDKVNSPQIKSWLNKVVGAEGEDLCRHDKWLCMMYPRLKLLHDLLNDEGIIFISIDDHELHNLRNIMDEIFGENNFLAQMTWRQMHTVRNSSKDFNKNTEYVLSYVKNKNLLIVPSDSKTYLRYPTDKEGSYPYDDNDGNGPYKLDPLHSRNFYTPYEHTFSNGYKWTAPKGTYPRYSPDNLESMDKEGIIVFNGTKLGKKDGTDTTFRGSVPVAKRYLKNVQEGVPPDTLLHSEIVGFSKDGTAEAMAIFGDKVFDQPKPSSLIKFLLSIKRSVDNNDYVVLDSFAGSGTTGQAVLELNKEDGGNRKFILIELERDISKKITAKRLKKIIEGYEGAKFSEGTGGGFQYLDLNGVLYDYSGYVNPDAQYEDMAAYIYFTETKNYLELATIKNPYIGSQGSTHYFLFFKDKGNNILDEETLKKAEGKGTKVIYADKCLIDEETLSKKGVIFKQIPYELKKF